MDNIYYEKVEKISNLLEKRASVFPLRDERYNELINEIQSFITYLLDNKTDDFKPNKNILEAVSRFSEYPIFICGSMKSGTTLLTQLLDGHSNLHVMPGDSHYVNKRNEWHNAEFTDIARYWIRRMINPSGKEPFWFLGPNKSDFEDFLNYLNLYSKDSKQDNFLNIVYSVFAANRKKSWNTIYWVEKTPGNELFADGLVKKFPHGKFIHVIRHPLENIVSLKKMAMIRGNPLSNYDETKRLKNLMKAGIKNRKKLGKKKYYFIKYEDLVRQPEHEMSLLCDFLKIPMEPILKRPTENGKPGISNSVYADFRVKGKVLDQSKRRKYTAEFTPSEIRKMAVKLYNEANRFGYTDFSFNSLSAYNVTFAMLIKAQIAEKMPNRLMQIYKNRIKT